MKYSSPAFAALAASPSIVDSYNLFSPRFTRRLLHQPSLLSSSSAMLTPFSSSFFSPFEQLLPFDQQQRNMLIDQTFRQSSPKYDLVETKEKFELSIHVPDGMSLDNIDVRLNQDDNILTILGQQETKNENSRFMQQFQQSFSLDGATKVNEMSAKMENGVLTITAPKDVSLLKGNVRKIPIMAGTTKSSGSVTKKNDENLLKEGRTNNNDEMDENGAKQDVPVMAAEKKMNNFIDADAKSIQT